MAEQGHNQRKNMWETANCRKWFAVFFYVRNDPKPVLHGALADAVITIGNL